MRACAERREDGTWISDEILESYVALHRLGLAHSVEARRGGTLVGGLYGVHLGGAFFGESMFHRERDASKVALVALVDRLVQQGFLLLDIQWTTAHLEQFGAIEIPREEYLARLRRAVAKPCEFGIRLEPRSCTKLHEDVLQETAKELRVSSCPSWFKARASPG